MERNVIVAKFDGQQVVLPGQQAGDAMFGNSGYTQRQADALRSCAQASNLGRLAQQESESLALKAGTAEMLAYASRFYFADSRNREQ